MEKDKIPTLRYTCKKSHENGVDFLKSYVNDILISTTKEIYHPAEEVGVNFISDDINSYDPELWFYLKTKKPVPSTFDPNITIPAGTLCKMQLSAETCTEFDALRQDPHQTKQFLDQYEFLTGDELAAAKQILFSNIKKISFSKDEQTGYEFFIITDLNNLDQAASIGMYNTRSHLGINKLTINGEDKYVDIWQTCNNTERDYIMLYSQLTYGRRATGEEIDLILEQLISKPNLLRFPNYQPKLSNDLIKI